MKPSTDPFTVQPAEPPAEDAPEVLTGTPAPEDGEWVSVRAAARRLRLSGTEIHDACEEQRIRCRQTAGGKTEVFLASGED